MAKIQIIALRDYIKRDGTIGKAERFFEYDWRLDKLEDVFDKQKVTVLLDKVPSDERYNLYFTVANCMGKRELAFQRAIPFDVDNVNFPPQSSRSAHFLAALFIDTVQKFYNKDYTGDGLALIWSGHGVQLFYFLKDAIQTNDFFAECRESYKEFCNLFQDALKKYNIEGTVDHSVFSPSRLMRFPETINRKPGREDAKSEILLFNRGENENFLQRKKEDQSHYIPKVALNKFQIDTTGVQEECQFLIDCKTGQEKITEPLWYAMLGVVGYLENGHELAHLYSHKHPSYSEHETDMKLNQAMSNSGPRTCVSINSLWGKCKGCKHYGNVKTPLQIISENFIQTEQTGFRIIQMKEDGTIKRGKPAYEDLKKAFAREFNYRSIDHGGKAEIIVYTKNVGWKSMSPIYIKEWTYNKIRDPKPAVYEINEFLSLLEVSNVTDAAFLDNWRGKYIAFKNCVLDIRSKETLEMTPEMGITEIVEAVYDKNAKAPRWKQFLEEVSDNDVDKMNLLEEFAGYAMMGMANKYQAALILQGGGANGKSVYLNTISKVFGTSNCSSLPLKELDKDFKTVAIRGKFLNSSTETSFDALSDSSTFKAAISGDPIIANIKYGPNVTFTPTAKFVLSCNNPPNIKDTSFGLNRRLLVVKFTKEFTEKTPGFDRDIEKKLLAEAPGIVNSLLEAYETLEKRNGFKYTEKMQEEKREFIKESNFMERFVGENFISAPGKFVSAQTIKEMAANFSENELGGMRFPAIRCYPVLVSKFNAQKVNQWVHNGKRQRGFKDIDIHPESDLVPHENY